MTTTQTTTPTTDNSAHSDRDRALQGVRDILSYLGQNPDRPGLTQTPRGAVDALVERTSAPGSPAPLLSVVFDDAGPTDQMITLTGVEFTSLCEHHLLPFTGTATVAYLPEDGRVVGLSKLARLVEHHARQPQVQERLTGAIAEDLTHHLAPRGVGVAIDATHTCMGLRGIRKPEATMRTPALPGAFLTNPDTRAEFLDSVR